MKQSTHKPEKKGKLETEHSQTRKERKTRNRAPHVALVSVLSINNAVNEV